MSPNWRKKFIWAVWRFFLKIDFWDPNPTFKLVCFVAFYWTAKKNLQALFSPWSVCVTSVEAPCLASAHIHQKLKKSQEKALKPHTKKRSCLSSVKEMHPFFLFSYFLIESSSIQKWAYYYKLHCYVCVSVRTHISILTSFQNSVFSCTSFSLLHFITGRDWCHSIKSNEGG